MISVITALSEMTNLVGPLNMGREKIIVDKKSSLTNEFKNKGIELTDKI